MTEVSYQECRKIMQKANYWRGAITTAKGNVSKWTKIEATYIQNLEQGRADGAKKQLDKAMKKLDEQRQKFAAIKLPDSDLAEMKATETKCTICGNLIAKGEECAECEMYDSWH